jgi:predicted MPP superfamily phosphohydrolase
MEKRARKRGLSAMISIITLGLLYAIIYEKYFFEIKCFCIGKKGSAIKLKLLFLTDLHFKKFLDPSYKKLARKINNINPDVILLGGDVIDEDGTYAPAREFFARVNTSIPKMVIMGNHDHKNRVGLHSYKRLYEQNNGTLLVNETRQITIAGKKLVVTGVDDFIEGNACFAKAVENIGKEENHVLLIHSPLQQEGILQQLKEINARRAEDKQLNIQFIFAGHNHGGQVCLFGFAPKMPEFAGNYLKGWYNSGPPYLYLSKGFGTSTLPVRFGARSEATLFLLGV